MAALKTIPQMQNAIEEMIKSRRHGEDPIFQEQTNNPCNADINYAFKQREVGFSGLFNRLMVHEWGAIQNMYY